MYYKIASFIINASKHQTGHREVFVWQPDLIKEKIAGRAFLVAELAGKRNESKKIADFLISSLDEYYYQDEKIFYQEKLKGLSFENLFEAALAKLNKAFLEFLLMEKISIRQEDFNVLIGLIYEDRLYFSNFGKNKVFLIYQNKNQHYEMINIETKAQDLSDDDASSLANSEANKHFFSSLVSGQMPESSYFLFSNEVLADYLSAESLIEIISKLPPLVAAEQIKNNLSEANSFVPFLGIIVKNTYGLSPSELREEAEISIQSAQSSISQLNTTEQQTEEMLSSAGLFSFQKLKAFYAKLKRKFKGAKISSIQKKLSPNLKIAKGSESALNRFLEKLLKYLKWIFQAIYQLLRKLFNREFYLNLVSNFKNKNAPILLRYRLILLPVLILLLFLGSWRISSNHRQNKKEDLEHFNREIAIIEERIGHIDSYLLYDNFEAAKSYLMENYLSLENLKATKAEQVERLAQINLDLDNRRAKIQKLIIYPEPDLLLNFSENNKSAQAENLSFIKDRLYASDSLAKALYLYDLKETKLSSILLNGELDKLKRPFYDADADKLYFLDGESLNILDLKSSINSRHSIEDLDDSEAKGLAVYNNKVYLLSTKDNQVYAFDLQAGVFKAKNPRLQGSPYLGDSLDLAINDKGHILVLDKDAKISDFLSGSIYPEFQQEEFEPKLDKADSFKVYKNDIFVLDRDSSRIIIFNDLGKLSAQLSFPNLEIQDFAVDYLQKKLYLLSNNSLYSVEY